MRKGYNKEALDIRYDRGAYRPAINVKAYRWPSIAGIAERFGCSHDAAQRALEYARESAQQRFWEDVQETAEHYLGEVKVWQEGRSGGWLVVDGLPEIESWDAIQLSKWARFEKAVRTEIGYLTSAESVCEDIDANQWTEEGAELYNFVDTASGPKTVGELKAHLAEARRQFVGRPA